MVSCDAQFVVMTIAKFVPPFGTVSLSFFFTFFDNIMLSFIFLLCGFFNNELLMSAPWHSNQFQSLLLLS